MDRGWLYVDAVGSNGNDGLRMTARHGARHVDLSDVVIFYRRVVLVDVMTINVQLQ